MELPVKLNQFYGQLGRAVLVHSFETTGWELPDYLEGKVIDSHDIDAGKSWCIAHHRQMEAVAHEARRVTGYDKEQAMISFMRAIVCNQDGLETFLQTARPVYFGELLRHALFRTKEPERNAFLQLLIDIAEDISTPPQPSVSLEKRQP